MDIRDVLQQADAELQKAIKEELRTQGHHLTGALEASITGTITEKPKSATLVGTALYYSQILSAGTTPARIPYSGRTGAAHSKYIEALINFFKLRGLDDEEAKRAAFATARKQKQEGMPTSASSKYSTTGIRLDFLGIVDKAMDTKLDQTVLGGIEEIVQDVFLQTKPERILI